MPEDRFGAPLERQRRATRSPPAGVGPDLFGPETTLEFEVEAPKTPKKSPAPAQKPPDMQKLQQQALEIFGGEWLGAAPVKEEPE